MPHHSTLSLHKEDIPALSAFFLGRFAAGRNLSLSPEATRLLAGYAWPGNIRELRNALEYPATVCSGKTIQPHHLPRTIHQAGGVPTDDDDLEHALQRWIASKVEAGATYK